MSLKEILMNPLTFDDQEKKLVNINKISVLFSIVIGMGVGYGVSQILGKDDVCTIISTAFGGQMGLFFSGLDFLRNATLREKRLYQEPIIAEILVYHPEPYMKLSPRIVPAEENQAYSYKRGMFEFVDIK